MIPFEWDDGFTVLLPGGIRVRPLLRTARMDLFRMTRPEQEKWVKQKMWESPRYWGPPPGRLDAATRAMATRTMISSQAEENKMLQSVVETAILLFENAAINQLSCHDCRQFATDPKAGKILCTPDGRPKRRHPLLPVPCEADGPGCPKGHWQSPKEPTTLGLAVWKHYWEMRAIGYAPRCPIIARNWSLLDWIVKYGRRIEHYPGGCRAAGGPAGDPTGRRDSRRGTDQPVGADTVQDGAVYGGGQYSPVRAESSEPTPVEFSGAAGSATAGPGCQGTKCGATCGTCSEPIGSFSGRTDDSPGAQFEPERRGL